MPQTFFMNWFILSMIFFSLFFFNMIKMYFLK